MDKRTELLLAAQHDRARLEKLVAKWELDYKVLEERNHATELDRDYWHDKYNTIQKGGIGYAMQDTFIVMAFPIEAQFDTTYPQEIDYNVINSRAYQKYPYYYVDNGKVCIDNEQHKKYIMEVI